MKRPNINQIRLNVANPPQHKIKQNIVLPNRRPFINPHEAEIFQQGFQQGYACAIREIMGGSAPIDDIVTCSDHSGCQDAGKG